MRECRYPLSLAAALAVWLITGAGIQDARAEPSDLTQLDLEELMNLKIAVTSAAKKPQLLNDVAAAIYVLSGDDIRRSGATSIPEALRFVPGLDVARVDQNSWAISARGFNSTFANKLLVLIDGRSVYSPLFSTILWSLQDTLIEDVDRIEVIRGPGAALWGANAVDGVINVITKPASETQGTLLVAGAGTEKPGFGAARYGGSFGTTGSYRLYTQYQSRAGTTTAAGLAGGDDDDSRQAGFRTDWKSSAADAFTLLGGANVERRGQSSIVSSFAPPFMTVANTENNDLAANLLGRWTHRFSAASDLSVQAYYTHEGYKRPDLGSTADIADIEIQHRFPVAEDHDFLWGGGYRSTASEFDGSPSLSFAPASSRQSLFNAFFQDDWTLIPQRLHLIAGSKFEHNDFTGFEIQPNLRLSWTPDQRQSVWVAASRAVRTPSVAEEYLHNMVWPGSPPISVPIPNENSLRSEKLVALEAGYRIRPTGNLSFDTAFFYNFHSDLRSFDLGTQTLSLSPVPHAVVPAAIENRMSGESAGMELNSEWQPIPGWRLRGNYSFLRMMLHPTAPNPDPGTATASSRSPHHQFVLQSSSDLGHDLEFDISLKHVSDLSGFPIGEYTTVDLRLAWSGIEGLELSLAGQNLFDGSRLQFQPDLLPSVPTKIGPSVYGKAVLRF